MFRVHCWNKYGKNKNENCPDLEIRYYVECTVPTDFGSTRYRRNAEIPFTCREKIQAVEPLAPTETFSIVSSLTTTTISTINGKKLSDNILVLQEMAKINIFGRIKFRCHLKNYVFMKKLGAISKILGAKFSTQFSDGSESQSNLIEKYWRSNPSASSLSS